MDGPGATRILFRLLFVIVAVVAISVLYLAKILFLPLAFAILFAFLLAPLVAWLEHLHLPRALAALAVIIGFATLLCGGTWFLFTQLVGITNDLPTYSANIDQKLAAIKSPSNSAFSRARGEVEHLSAQLGLANSLPPGLAPGKPDTSKPLGSTPDRPVQVREVSRSNGRLDQLGGVFEPLAIALLSIVFTFFVLVQREDLRNRLIRLGGYRNLSLVTEAMDDASKRMSRYFRLLLSVNLVYGAIIFGALFLLGLPHALLFGTLAGLFRFVPYIGAPCAGALPTLLSLAVFHGWERSLAIVAIFTFLEIVTANYLEPHIYGKHTGLSSLAILVAASFWTLIWGPVGLLLSVPLTVCLVVMSRHVPALNFLTVMLGDQPPMPAWTCFYQRLLAGDEREAGEILESCATNMPLPNVFDSVLVPALVMSEEDRLHRDLDESTVHFIQENVREMIEELGYRENHGTNNGIHEPVAPQPRAETPSLRVLCIPVRDETDELSGLMLAKALDNGSVHAFAMPIRRLDEIVESASREKPDLIFLTGLPPFAFGRGHRIYRGLRARLPRLRIAAGIWNYSENPAEAAQKIGGSEDVRVYTRVEDAVADVREMAGVPAAAHSEASPSEVNNQTAA
ncbi:MAG TPA: AI-2E family transporter [Terracidiphilus sp.]|jgi:predicted PurR-regulated permease PerM|nr:AI-2E family transporter [Terracidiphilus sp.]